MSDGGLAFILDKRLNFIEASDTVGRNNPINLPPLITGLKERTV